MVPDGGRTAATARPARGRRATRAAGAQLALPASGFAEVLVGAARRGEEELDTRRRQLLAAFGPPLPADEAVAVAAAALRARHRWLRLPDAFVLATAEVAAAQAVLTGDRKWSDIDLRTQLVLPAGA